LFPLDYGREWQALGTETVEILPSIGEMVLAHQGLRGKGTSKVRHLCQLIRLRAPDSEVLVHVFSNNGFIFFGSCLVVSADIAPLVSAVILDSSPCYITPSVAATGLVSATMRVEAEEAASSWQAAALRRAILPLLSVMDPRQRRAWDAWTVQKPMLAAPHLFLYSSRDAVVPAQDIESFARLHCQRLGRAGVESRIEKWSCGAHCGLLREDPAKYQDQIKLFLQTHV